MNRRVQWGSAGGDCCDCCGGPCHSEPTDSLDKQSCCNSYCCTCYPQQRPLEATVMLRNCSGPCNGILGVIDLAGPGPSASSHPWSNSPVCQELIGAQAAGYSDCRKQICLPDDPDTGEIAEIREMWGGAAYLCCKEPTTNQFGCPQEDYKNQDCGGQPFALSVCCCAGNNTQQGPCNTNQFSCSTISAKVHSSSNPTAERNKWCSCSCYRVDMHSLPHSIGGTEGIFCSEIVDQSSSCYSQNLPGCPNLTSCPMDITFCQCNQGGDGGPEGWMIKAEKRLDSPLSCDCCPGRPDMPPGFGGGGCVAGAIIEVLICPKGERYF